MNSRRMNVLDPRDRKLVAAPERPSDSYTADKSAWGRTAWADILPPHLLTNSFPCLSLVISSVRGNNRTDSVAVSVRVTWKHMTHMWHGLAGPVLTYSLNYYKYLILIAVFVMNSIPLWNFDHSQTRALTLRSIIAQWRQNLKKMPKKFTGKDMKMINENKA